MQGKLKSCVASCCKVCPNLLPYRVTCVRKHKQLLFARRILSFLWRLLTTIIWRAEQARVQATPTQVRALQVQVHSRMQGTPKPCVCIRLIWFVVQNGVLHFAPRGCSVLSSVFALFADHQYLACRTSTSASHPHQNVSRPSASTLTNAR